MQLFVDGADQHLPPETLDESRGLVMLLEPGLHGDLVEIMAGEALSAHREQPAAEGDFLAQREPRGAREGPGKVQRWRQPARVQSRNTPAGLDEIDVAVEVDLVAGAEAVIKVE